MAELPGREDFRILAVEDEPDHLLAVEMLFRGVPGYVFFGAASTAEADTVLLRERIDLVLLDLALPGEDGIAFAKRIKSQPRFRDLVLVAFSAFPSEIYEDKARAAGCVAYFSKPFHPRELMQLVASYAAARRGGGATPS